MNSCVKKLAELILLTKKLMILKYYDTAGLHGQNDCSSC